MYSTTSAGLDAGALREQLMGAVTVPGDAGWDAARQAWNLAVDQRPPATAAARVEERQAGVEYDRPPLHGAKLLQRIARIARFAYGLALEIRDLVGADDQRVGMGSGDPPRLGLRESHRGVGRCLARLLRFIERGRCDREREA